MTAVSDADRAKAAEANAIWEAALALDDGEEWRPLAAALAEARAPYDRLTADLRALAEELDRADELVAVAVRLRAVVAAAEEAKA